MKTGRQTAEGENEERERRGINPYNNNFKKNLNIKASTVAFQANPPTAVPVSHMGADLSPGIQLRNQIPANSPWKQLKKTQVLGLPSTQVGDWEEALGSRLQTGPVLAFVLIWEVSQQIKDFPPLSVFLTLK